jgi:hypothetical protein
MGRKKREIRYIVDDNGRKTHVILSINAFNEIVDNFEKLVNIIESNEDKFLIDGDVVRKIKDDKLNL